MRERILRRLIVSAIAVACCIGSAAVAAESEAPPVVPGVVRLRDEAKASAVEQGEVLLGELNCLACHAAPSQKRVFTKGAPDLGHAGARLTPQYIRQYILDSHGVKPGSTMPDLFHASDPEQKAQVADFITNYLVSLGGPIKPSNEEGNSVMADRGKALFHRIGCVACHSPQNVKTAIPSVPFPNLAEKTTVENLQAFLLDPVRVRPGSRMPSLVRSKEEAHDLAIYLLREQMENPQSKAADLARVPGVKYTYYEAAVRNGSLEQMAHLKPKSEGRAERFTLDFPGHRNNNFVVKYTGAFHVAKAGRYTFTTSSDDGSRVYVNGQLVVNNDGTHPPTEKSGTIELAEGDQQIVVTYYQLGGEWVLKVLWEGPGIAKEEIPADALFTIGGRPMVPLNSETFAVDPQKAQMGGMMFSAIGCVQCHVIPGAGKAMRPRKALAELDADLATGCLGDQIPKSTPNYYLSEDQRTALKAAVKNVKELDQPLEPRQQAAHLAAAFNCYACHVRDKAGGPTTDRTQFFVMIADFDMGDEGRFPPRLTNVGAKLTPAALEQIICEGKLHVRPVLATRMPMFAKDKVEPLIESLVQADAPAKEADPSFDATAAKDGRQLFGNRGMGCMNCHGINGVKSLGSMPAPDLGNTHDRLRYGWFHALLADPAHVNPGTRMPAFWTNGDIAYKTLAGGTMDGQIAALWSYLSLGPSMALPAGLNAGGDELVPADEPIVHRTFFTGAGNRGIAVGFPEMLHVAFDADVVRLAIAWKGRFFDARGMWEGRGGQHLGPLGTEVMDFPPGPSFAVLGKPDAEWPTPKPTFQHQVERNLGGRFKGYVLDKEERPTFHYILNDIDIQEQPVPVLKTGGAVLQRKFQLTGKSATPGLYFIAVQGKAIDDKGSGQWLVDGKTTVRLDAKNTGLGQAVIRDSGSVKQLLFPVTLNNNSAAFTVEMSW